MKILFLGSGPFGIPTLQRLHSLRDDVAVATVPDAPHGRKRTMQPSVIKSQAQTLGLPIFESEKLRGAEGQRVLEESAADLVITADIRLILGPRFLAGAPRGCYNLHGSILPRWRGAAPVVRALLSGDEELGVTLYRMVSALDAGPVVGCQRWTPDQTVTAEDAELKLSHLAADLLQQHLDALESGDVVTTEQSEEAVTLAPKVEKSEAWVHWEGDAAFLQRQVRALKPWPRTRSRLIRQSTPERIDEVILDQVSQIHGMPEAQPGTVLEVNGQQIVVACGQGAIAIERLQRIGKKPMSVQEILRGMPFQVGDHFQGEARP